MTEKLIRLCSLLVSICCICMSACSFQSNEKVNKELSSINSERTYANVTFESNGGSKVDSLTVKIGETLSAPKSPVKEGNVFCGWHTNPDAEAWIDSIDLSTYIITEDITLYAIWGSEDLDIDGDGLSHKEEIKYSTNPYLYDTDNDGLCDGEEINKHHTNPLSDDTDGDTLTDGFELAVKLEPLKKSSDGKSNDANRNINYSFSDTDKDYSLTVDGNAKILSSVSTSTFDKSIINNSENLIGDIINIEKDTTDSFKTATLVYSYKDKNLGGINEKELSILYLNEDTGKYEIIPSIIDKGNKTISAKLSHFSKYAVGNRSLKNSTFSLFSENIIYNGKTINAIEVADSGFDLFKHSFAFHNFQNETIHGFCAGFTLVTYLNYMEKLPISGERFSTLALKNLPQYNLENTSRFQENQLYIESEKNIFNKANNYRVDKVELSDSIKESINCIQHWMGKQHNIVDQLVSPNITGNRYMKLLKKRLQSGEPVPLNLSGFAKSGMHFVLAYKMYQTQDADYILVYDSNKPGEKSYIKISKLWSFYTNAEYDDYSTIKIAYVEIPDGPYVSHTPSQEIFSNKNLSEETTSSIDDNSNASYTPSQESSHNTNNIYSAYLEVVENLIQQHGNIKVSKQGYYTGLAIVKLIDFDNDGKTELYCVYSENNDVYANKQEVYALTDNKNLSSVYKGDVNNLGTSVEPYVHYAGCNLLTNSTQSLDSTSNLESSFTWSKFNGKDFQKYISYSLNNKLQVQPPFTYSIDGREVTESDYLNAISFLRTGGNKIFLSKIMNNNLIEETNETIEILKLKSLSNRYETSSNENVNLATFGPTESPTVSSFPSGVTISR